MPRKSVVRLTDRPDMTLDVYRGRKTTMQQNPSASIQWASNPTVPTATILRESLENNLLEQRNLAPRL